MSTGAGVLRSATSLGGAADTLARIAAPGASRGNTASWEATNLMTVAAALVGAALRRAETRGCHWREDFPETEQKWRGHLLAGLDGTGALAQTWEPMP